MSRTVDKLDCYYRCDELWFALIRSSPLNPGIFSNFLSVCQSVCLGPKGIMLSLLQRWWGVRLVSTLRLLPQIYRLCSSQNQSYGFIVGSPPVRHLWLSLPKVSRFPLNLGHLGVNKVNSFDIVVHLHRKENVSSAPPSAPFLVQTKQWALGPQNPLGLIRDGEVRGWG